jgi:hypothetical protein
MPGNGDDDLLAEFDSVGEPARLRPTLRTELDTVDVVGAPDASGTSTMRTGESRIRFGDEVDADAPLARAPKGPATAPDAVTGARLEREGRQRQERRERVALASDAAAHSPVWDALVAGGTMQMPGRRSPEAARTAERASQVWDEFTSGDARLGGRNPIDPIIGIDRRGEAPIAGATSTMLFNMGDEAVGAASALTGGDYREARDRQRSREREARTQAPSMYGVGQVAGAAPLMAIPGAGAASATIGAPARAALALGQGAQMGGMAAFGASEYDLADAPIDVARETAEGAGLGAVMGLGGELAGTAIGALRRGPRVDSHARDEALLAATGHAGNNRSAVEAFDFGDTHDQIMQSRARAAQVLRETGAVPAIAGMGGTARSIERALRGATGTMDDVSTAMGARGPTGSRVAERLRARATADQSPTAGPRRALLEDFAERYGGQVDEATGAVTPLPGMRAPDQPIDYRALMEDIGNLRDAGSYRTRAGQDVNLREQGMRRITRELRDAYDDEIEAQLGSRTREAGAPFRSVEASPERQAAAARLGEDPVAAYRRARQQYAVLEDAMGNARRGEAATAGNRTVGMSEMHWANTGATVGSALGGPLGAMLGGAGAAIGGAAARGVRAVGPRVSATASSMLYDVAREYPQQLMQRLLPQTAQQLTQAASRGPSAFATTLYVLSQRDAEVRRLMESYESEREEEQR